MSRQRSRAARRRRYTQNYTAVGKVELPGPLRVLTHPKVFAAIGIIFALAIFGGLLYGTIQSNSSSNSGVQQANEAADVPTDEEAAGSPSVEVTPTTKRFETAPAMSIDPNKKYTAVIQTTKGEVVIELDAKLAPQTVNSFVFLARQGYYNNNPFIQSLDNGRPFTAATGDPTGTGEVRPGYFTPGELNTNPFARGAVGMGGTQGTENDGRFWVAFGDYPAYNGKFTIFGRVVSGLDVLEKLTYVDPKSPSTTSADKIVSVEIRES